MNFIRTQKRLDLKRRVEVSAFLRSLVLPFFIFQSCSGNYHSILTSSATSSNSKNMDETIGKRPSARVSFHFSDYYSLSNPHSETSCAGDIKNYYDSFEFNSKSSSPLKFPESENDLSTTTHPAFIKNVSVDLTHANSYSPLNMAYSCSLGRGPTIPQASACATFDYGAIGGLPTHLGGSVLLVGGLKNSTWDSLNLETFALGINTLPATAATDPPNPLAPGITSATGPMSTWANLSTASDYSGPKGLVGAAIAYDAQLERLITWSGTSPLNSSPHQLNWFFDIKTQTWSQSQASSFVKNEIQTFQDIDESNNTLHQWQKPSGSRYSFGYRAAPGFSLSGMSTNGQVQSNNIDRTDRIIIAGGYGSYGYDVRKLNPTYGPEWNDVLTASFNAQKPNQWIDSYHTQLMFNHESTSKYRPKLGGGTDPVDSFHFSMAPARNNSSDIKGAGYLYALGGFKANSNKNSSTTGGALHLFGRGTTTVEANASSYSAIPNFPKGDSTSTQGTWSEIKNDVPWYGASQLLPGFSLYDNELVFFGGTDCPNYLSSTSSGCNLNISSSKYWRLSFTPIQAPSTFSNPTEVSFSGSPPPYAGMAAERGLDPKGNVIIIAFGGASNGTGSGPVINDSKIYYLYNKSGTPTWVSTSSENTPPPVAEGALVFSHVTRKFYLFGGFLSNSQPLSQDTWELSIGPDSTTECKEAGSCTFTWRKLTAELTCFPDCPISRRGHRMTEVNYYNRNPWGYEGDNNGEQSCTNPQKPCSYGIFMEGGTHDGSTSLGDRWMFDPTANNGVGHWQKMGEFPPRNFAAMSTVDYYVPTQNKTVHRALLFGGETGLNHPENAAPLGGNKNYLIPPTLGDTWMYDFDQNTWHRVELLGKGWKDLTLPKSSFFSSESEARESYSYTDTSTPEELSPPPLSGAIMVTRTRSSSITPLAIPEIYLFGGRQKDGTLLPLDHVYKFCAGTTGEKPYLSDGMGNHVSQSGNLVLGSDDATCDSYDAITNPYSPHPSHEYQGRWIRKTPPSTSSIDPSKVTSLHGKAIYDPFNDRIVLVGGLSGKDGPKASTDSANLDTSVNIYEYTPPSKTQGIKSKETEGYWEKISLCTGSSVPQGRYGHSLSFDLLNHQLVLVGGAAIDETPWVQTMTYLDGRTYDLPEIWTAKRSSASNCYTWSQISIFSNSIDIPAQKPPMSGLIHPVSAFIPSDGYNTGFYTLLDSQCIQAGPIGVGDPTLNKLMAGGVYLDIDRKNLGERENLLLHLKWIPMGPNNEYSNGSQLNSSEAAIFKIHLIKSGLSLTDIRLALQPRYLLFSDADRYPKVIHTLSIIAPPASGQIQEDQIFLPVAMDPQIDRIRIERYSGTGILIDASLYRLGVGNP